MYCLIIFPIKSCSGFELDTWEIGNYGFLYDREWSLINSENKVLQTIARKVTKVKIAKNKNPNIKILKIQKKNTKT